jgi:hypothetical protein
MPDEIPERFLQAENPNSEGPGFLRFDRSRDYNVRFLREYPLTLDLETYRLPRSTTSEVEIANEAFDSNLAEIEERVNTAINNEVIPTLYQYHSDWVLQGLDLDDNDPYCSMTDNDIDEWFRENPAEAPAVEAPRVYQSFSNNNNVVREDDEQSALIRRIRRENREYQKILSRLAELALPYTHVYSEYIPGNAAVAEGWEKLVNRIKELTNRESLYETVIAIEENRV